MMFLGNLFTLLRRSVAAHCHYFSVAIFSALPKTDHQMRNELNIAAFSRPRVVF
jgi:hypothetical protein